ncbi:MAG TPA: bifunctional nuclease family protein [Nitrospiraceae bacterium]|nr:bifunctional nuclease family protein [Nitrospiraceae bacterium]
MNTCRHLLCVGLLLLGVMSSDRPVAAETAATTPTDLVTIAEVKVRVTDHGPVVLLQAEGKAIPIFVDLTVALSIQAALIGDKLDRPMSHDLMSQILRTYGGKVTQTVITLKGGTYYGALTVAFRDDVKVFDSRSSDSIALAVHFKAPILVGRDLLNSAGRVLEKSKTEDL